MSCLADGKDTCPLVMVGGVLEANRKWDIGKEVINRVSKEFPRIHPIRPKVITFSIKSFFYALSQKVSLFLIKCCIHKDCFFFGLNELSE